MRSAARVGMLAVTAAIGVVLGGCTVTGSTSHGLPHASNGTNLQACASGNCEVQVGTSAQIPLPETAFVQGLQVQAISSNSVTVTGRSVGLLHSGPCSGNCSASSSVRGVFQLTLGSQGVGVENNLQVQMLGTDGKSAVLLISPRVRRG